MAVSSIVKAVDFLEYAIQGPDMHNMRARMRGETVALELKLMSDHQTAKAHQSRRRPRRTLRNSGMNLNSLTEQFLKLLLFHATDGFLQ